MQEKPNREAQIIKKLLFESTTKKARERINMVRSVNPELAQKAELASINLAQRNQKKINEAQVKQILGMLSKK